jgi:uncharacterized protein YqfB (UPF0267 family)
MITDSFRGDIEFILNLLKNKENFSFSKYADGEFAILTNQHIRNIDNWVFNPNQYSEIRDELLQSFTFKDDKYYVGISCKCCQPLEHVNWMRKHSEQDILTWANIFVNSNYPYFKVNFIPEFNNHDVVLFAREDARIAELPFIVEHIPITKKAFIDNFNMVNNFPIENYKNKLFLFCAGPLGNMLAAKFWQKNKFNIYLDIGSTLNPYLTESNRSYLKNSNTTLKTCIW